MILRAKLSRTRQGTRFQRSFSPSLILSLSLCLFLPIPRGTMHRATGSDSPFMDLTVPSTIRFVGKRLHGCSTSIWNADFSFFLCHPLCRSRNTQIDSEDRGIHELTRETLSTYERHSHPNVSKRAYALGLRFHEINYVFPIARFFQNVQTIDDPR